MITDKRNGDEHGRRTDNWHFEKRLDVSTLISILGISLVLGGPIFVWGRAMEATSNAQNVRIQLLELQNSERTKLDQMQNEEAKAQRNVMLARIDRFDEQMNLLRVEIARLTFAVNSAKK